MTDNNPLSCVEKTSQTGSFKLDDDNILLHGESSKPYACPIEDNKYGVYLDPGDNLDSCISITIQTTEYDVSDSTSSILSQDIAAAASQSGAISKRR